MSQTAIINFTAIGADPLPQVIRLLWHSGGGQTAVPSTPAGFTFLIPELDEINVGSFFNVDFDGETDLSKLNPLVSVNVSAVIGSTILNFVINIEDYLIGQYNYENEQFFNANRAYFVLVSKRVFVPAFHYEYELKTIDQRYMDYKRWSESTPGVPLVINKPKKFTINAVNLQNPYNIPYNNLNKQKNNRLEVLAQTLNNLGFNTVIPENWKFINGTMPSGMTEVEVNTILNNNGITKRQTTSSEYFANTPFYPAFANGTPAKVIYLANNLTLMDFYAHAVGKANILDWVQKDVIHSLKDYQSQENACYLVDVKLKDEPAWFLSELFKAVSYDTNDSMPLEIQTFLDNNGLSVSAFRKTYLKYLHAINSDPKYWGQTQWNDIIPIGAGIGNRYINPSVTPEQQRLFYYTILFFLNEPSNALIRFADAMSTEINNKFGINIKFNIDTNQNNYFSTVYQGNLFPPFDGNNDVTWNGAVMFYDYFNNGRINKTISQAGNNSIALWFEDWYHGGLYLPRMSFYGELLRSAAMAGLPDPNESVWPSSPSPGSPGSFGIYSIPFNGYKNPDEWQYRVMSFLGKGAKQVDYFMFGPAPISINTWSEYRSCYNKIAEINNLIGNAENVLYPGRPARSKICILITKCSDFYNSGSREYQMYQVERSNLHHALCHAGYSVDYIDEIDVEQNKLQIRGYKTLYVTDPNLPSKCADIIKTWVYNGGTLAVVAGAAVSNEFNTYGLTAIDEILGLQPREDIVLEVGKVDPSKRNNYFYPITGYSETELQDIRLRLTKLEISQNYTDLEAGKELIFVEQPSKRILQKTFQRNYMDEITTARIPVVNPITKKPLNTLVYADGATVDLLCTLNFKDNPSELFGKALTKHAYGSGFGFAFSFFPGHQYAQSTEHVYDGKYDNYMPFNWIKDFRDLTLIPVRTSLVPPNVMITKIINFGVAREIQEPELEVNILTSDAGIALTLLNWVGKENYLVLGYRIDLIIDNPMLLNYSVSSAKGRTCNIIKTTHASGQSSLSISVLGAITVDVLSLIPLKNDVCRCGEKCKDKTGFAKYICEMFCSMKCMLIKIYNNIGPDKWKGPASDGSDWTNLEKIKLPLTEFSKTHVKKL